MGSGPQTKAWNLRHGIVNVYAGAYALSYL
jgi:hypothetical protein